MALLTLGVILVLCNMNSMLFTYLLRSNPFLTYSACGPQQSRLPTTCRLFNLPCSTNFHILANHFCTLAGSTVKFENITSVKFGLDFLSRNSTIRSVSFCRNGSPPRIITLFNSCMCSSSHANNLSVSSSMLGLISIFPGR